MAAPEYNLIDEKWIRVLNKDSTVKQVSLLEVLVYAHEFVDLAGELITQDVAIMRILLAVLHTVFNREEFQFTDQRIKDPKQRLREKWKFLWKKYRQYRKNLFLFVM